MGFDKKNIIIGTTTIGNSTNTLGLHIVSKELIKAGYNVKGVSVKEAQHVDILLISLYWVDQIIRYPQWLVNAKINVAEKKPIIIIGGSMVLNPYPLKNMFHYAVFGDGEKITLDLIDCICNGREITNPSILINDSEESWKEEHLINVAPELLAEHYVEDRTNKITRIEIARGCKFKCKFCQLAHIKPYRELSPYILKNLIATAPTKTVALFAADRGSYSAFDQVEDWCKKYGKANMGTDIRLSSTKKIKMIERVRFGLEGFSERERTQIQKPYKNEEVIKDLSRIFREIKNKKGGPIKTAICYMILDLPGQNENDYREFQTLLKDLDSECSDIKHKKTLFISFSDFLPHPHTPMELSPKNIWTDHIAIWQKYKPYLKNVVIAEHGGSRGSATRIAYLLAIRGINNANIGIYNLSTNPKLWALTKDRSLTAGKKMYNAMQKCGIDINGLITGKIEPVWNKIKLPSKLN